MKNSPKSTLKAIVNLRAAGMDDFAFREYGVQKRKVGLPYFLRNGKGDLECYHLTDNTKVAELAQFIKEGRCFLLDNQHPGSGRMIEEL